MSDTGDMHARLRALREVIERACHSDEEYTTLVGAMPSGLSPDEQYLWLGRRAAEVIPEPRVAVSHRLQTDLYDFVEHAVAVLPEGDVRREGAALLARCVAHDARVVAIRLRELAAS